MKTPQKELTASQKRERTKRMISIKIKKFAHQNNMPDPFPITPVEKKKYEEQKNEELENNPFLGNWEVNLKEIEWTHECINREDILRVLKNKPDKRTWGKIEWTVYYMANILKMMIEEPSNIEFSEV